MKVQGLCFAVDHVDPLWMCLEKASQTLGAINNEIN